MWVVVVLLVGMGLALASSAAAKQGVQEGGNDARSSHWPIMEGRVLDVWLVSLCVVVRVLWGGAVKEGSAAKRGEKGGEAKFWGQLNSRQQQIAVQSSNISRRTRINYCWRGYYQFVLNEINRAFLLPPKLWCLGTHTKNRPKWA